MVVGCMAYCVSQATCVLPIYTHVQGLTKPFSFFPVEFIIISVSTDNFCLFCVKLEKPVIL